MKRLTLILSLCVWAFGLHAQIGEFNPVSPGDPNPFYRMEVQVSPAAGGTANISYKLVQLGDMVYVHVSPARYFVFQQWVCGDSVLSTSQELWFTMPARNVTLTAQMLYDPANSFNPPSPPDPQPVMPKHKVTIYTNPSSGGSVNESVFMMEEGEQWQIYAYPNAGYEFLGWFVNNELVSRTNPVRITMGTADLSFTARFQFNPTPPDDPNANSFDPTTGFLLLDRFRPGHIYDALNKLFGEDIYSQRQLVLSLMMVGEMNDDDCGYMALFENLTSADLSRTMGYSTLPAWTFAGLSALEQLQLPACVNTIGRHAFYECNSLREITLYAMAPPAVDSTIFDLSDSVIIRVPASALPLYQAHPYWSHYTIHGLDSRKLTVVMPEQTIGLYQNMFLELLDTKSGQQRRYVITERLSFVFDNVFDETSYQVSVRNAQGRVLGQEEVDINTSDTTIQLEQILQPMDVQMVVLNNSGVDLTDLVTVTWYDSEGEYLHKGHILPGQVEGDVVTCKITLTDQTGGEYLQPAEQAILLSPQQPVHTTTLQAPAMRTLRGKVLDATTMQPIRSADITVAQVLNNKYPKLYSAQTDQQGIFAVTMLDAAADIAVSAAHYGSKTIAFIGDTSVVQAITLEALSGTVITLSYQYMQAVETGSSATPQDWYQDYRNIDYAVYNRTRHQAITNPETSMQQITLPYVLQDGDSVEVTATSRNQGFVPVVVGGRVNDNLMAVTLTLVEPGGIRSSYQVGTNAGAVALLYDSLGNMLKRADYSGKQVTFAHLDEGAYTLVSMEKTARFSSISRLSEFANVGMEAGRDYVEQPVIVQNGRIATFTIDTMPEQYVPAENYMAVGTSFTSNKTSIVSGTYLTLRGKLEFLPQYKNEVTQVKLIVDLPESAALVDNAVTVGSHLSTNYTTEGQRIIIPVENLSELVRFCVIPTVSGEYQPSAYVQFSHHNRTIMQPIGSAFYMVEDASISVMINYNDMQFVVSGQSMPASEVKVYDGETMIGNTTVNPSGAWNTTCDIPNAYNLSVHDIYAVMTTPSGLNLTTQVQEAKIVVTDIRPESVSMTFHNAYSRQNIVVVWNYLTGKTSSRSYSFYTETNFTFKVRFSNNSPQYVQEAILQVYTDNNAVHSVPLTYDASLACWVGNKVFGAGALPVRVGVKARINSEVKADSQQIHDWLTRTAVDPIVVDDDGDVMQRIQDAINVGNLDLAAYLLDSLEADVEMPTREWTDEEIMATLDSLNPVIGQDPLVALGYNLQTLQNSLAVLTAGFTYTDCTGLNEAQLNDNGFNAFPKTQGGFFYVYASESRWEVVDFAENIHYSVVLADNPAMAAATRALATADQDGFVHFFNELNTYINKINAVVQTLAGEVTAIQQTINKQSALIRTNQGILKKAYAGATTAGNKLAILQKRIILRSDLHLNNTRLASIGQFRFLQTGKGFSIAAIVGIFLNAVNDGLALARIYDAVLPCPNDLVNANLLRSDIVATGTAAGIYYLAQAGVAIVQLLIFESACGASLFTAGSSLVVAGMAVAALTLNFTATVLYNENFEKALAQFTNRLNALECYQETPQPTPPSSSQDVIWREFPSSFQPITPILDPSGYVYEAVCDNRVEGVQATIYYRKTSTNAIGETVEEDVIWDAENYDQQNPLYTDAQGMYQWDVPQGLWQVRFQKDGYESTQSEWLPVPPPQLEVNIPIVQLRQPEVQTAEAFIEAINITFDKFMQPELLNSENITVTANEQVVSGTLSLLNERITSETDSSTYASRVRFVPDQPFTTPQVTLTISNRVRSYADVPMAETFSQTFLLEGLIPFVPAAAPVASVPTGTILLQETELYLSSSTPNAIIRYTLDGTEPDCETGLLYTGYPILLSATNLQVRAIACADGFEASSVSVFEYSFQPVSTDLSENSEPLTTPQSFSEPTKVLRDAHLFILLPNGQVFDSTGKRIE
ncbi:MAG: chitobiase/beta-hexosaminidase C-terminal domain-containing protein [Paludibacteraceae bacterium]|nr:chitobiase/beta-hexosaminidase C-terminal domain-containing protein [Paludibacteraceae bacterium]